jgi:hypothetical protein
MSKFQAILEQLTEAKKNAGNCIECGKELSKNPTTRFETKDGTHSFCGSKCILAHAKKNKTKE